MKQPFVTFRPLAVAVRCQQTNHEVGANAIRPVPISPSARANAVRPYNLVAFLLLAGILAACQSGPSGAESRQTATLNAAQTRTAVTIARSSWTSVPVATEAFSPTPMPPTLTPSITPTPTATRTPTATATETPRPTFTPTFTPSRAVTMISSSVPGQFGGAPATWTPLPPLRADLAEHFVFQRPFIEGLNNAWARTYSYGSTDRGLRKIHKGIDITNPNGVPVLAVMEGTVWYSGDDVQMVFGPVPDFYGRVVVIEHPIKDGDGQTIYTLYGHLSRVSVAKGDHVDAGQPIGAVGAAGIATGPHLHLEVRVDKPLDYGATLNPELWVMPCENCGVLVGRVMDLRGKLLPGIMVEVQIPNGLYYTAFSYADDTVNPDPIIDENFVIPDIPAGYYNVFVNLPNNGLSFRTLMYIWPGKVNWIDIHLNQ